MKVRVPQRLTTIKTTPSNNGYRVPCLWLRYALNELDLEWTGGDFIAGPWMYNQFEDDFGPTPSWADIWVEGPDEDVALLKLKYF